MDRKQVLHFIQTTFKIPCTIYSTTVLPEEENQSVQTISQLCELDMQLVTILEKDYFYKIEYDIVRGNYTSGNLYSFSDGKLKEYKKRKHDTTTPRQVILITGLIDKLK